MNIFVLHRNPKICAQYHCDKHVIKMIIETAQLLYSSLIICGIVNHNIDEIIKTAPLTKSGNHGYKKTHQNHPCCRWVCESTANYEWLCNLGIELCKQYNLRYGKTHATQQHIEWLYCVCPKINNNHLTNFAIVMPDHYKTKCPIKSYRKYYIEAKKFATWKNKIPTWFLNH